MLRSSDRREIAEMINAALRRLGERISNRVNGGEMSDNLTAGGLAEMLGSSGADEIECDLCGVTVETLADAIAGEWNASYFIGDDESGAPCCPKCAAEKCRVSEDGELELIQDIPPAGAVEPPTTPTAPTVAQAATPAPDWGDGMNDATGDAADLARLETADSALGRAARALYMIGEPAAVRLGEAIEPILGEVQKMLAAAKAAGAAKPAEAELIS